MVPKMSRAPSRRGLADLWSGMRAARSGQRLCRRSQAQSLLPRESWGGGGRVTGSPQRSAV